MPVDAFRLGFVPGVTPAKWVHTWQQRHQTPLELNQLDVRGAADDLARGNVDMALMRPPVDPATVSAIPLYTEVPVVLAGKEHALAALEPGEEVGPADLADEPFLVPEDDVYPTLDHIPGTVLDHRPATTADAVTLVAAGTGLLIVPLSLAKLHHRRDVVRRPLADGPPAQVLLAWLTEKYSDEVEDFIGVVRGRTVNSTRGRQQRSGSPAGKARTTGNSKRGTSKAARAQNRRPRGGRSSRRRGRR